MLSGMRNDKERLRVRDTSETAQAWFRELSLHLP
jgi:hypothetical protein